MSLRSNSSLSIYSALSPSHSTASFYPRPPQAPPNKTLHIADLRSDPCNGKTVQEELHELLSRQLGFFRVKIRNNRNHIGCFAVAYFASIQCATDAKNNLQGHPFPGSSRGLRIDYMTPPKIEASSPDQRDDTTSQPQNQRSYLHPNDAEANQPQSLQTKHSYEDLNDIPGPHWGYGPGVSPVDPDSSSPPRAPPAGLVGRKSGSSVRGLGDQAFDFSYGAKTSNLGLQASIYSDINSPPMSSARSGKNRAGGAEKLKEVFMKSGDIESKDPTTVAGVGSEQANVSSHAQREKAKVASLPGPGALPGSLNEQDNAFKDDPRQEKLRPENRAAGRLGTANPEVIVETVPVLIGGGGMGAMEAEMILALQEVTIDGGSDSKFVRPVALKPEVVDNPQVTVNPESAFDNWDDEF